MVGIDTATDFTLQPWLREGQSVRDLRDDEILVGSEAYRFMGISEVNPGDTLFFYNRQFTVAGVLEPTGIGIDDSGFVTLDAIYSMAGSTDAQVLLQLDIEPGQISSIMVNTFPDADKSRVAATIGQTIRGVAVVTSEELISSSVAEQLENLKPILPLIGAGFWVIAVLMIAALFSMIVNERRRELGLLQAMGASRRFVFGMVVLEAVQLTLAGGAVGLVLGGAALTVLEGPVASSMGIGYLSPGALFISLFVSAFLMISVLTGVVAALYPAIAASRMEPYQAIRTGE